MSASAATAGLLQPLRQERALLWCVLVSIVLHVLVFLGLVQRIAPAPPAKSLLVLTARLAPVATAPRVPPPAPMPKPVAPPQQVPSKPAARPRPLPAAPAPAPATAPATAPAPAPAASTRKPAEAAQTAPPEAAAADAAPASARSAAASQDRAVPQPPVGTTTESGARTGSEADTGTLEQYRLALIVATRRYKRYPAIAMENGWQGRVEVHMVIGVNGMIASASIKTSSGHEILDKQALDMLKKGKTTVPIPASLRGREFSIDVPVIFNLDNPGA
jgi:protein TonB